MALTGHDISQKTGERIGATVGGMVGRFALPWVVKVIFGLLFRSCLRLTGILPPRLHFNT